MRLYTIIIVVLGLCFIGSGCDVLMELLLNPPQEVQTITLESILENLK